MRGTVQRILFIGENPSSKAVTIGANWQTAQLAGKTLHAALDAANVPHEARHFLNLFGDQVTPDMDEFAVARRVRRIRRMQREGFQIVGMGRKVQQVLARRGVGHLQLTHPAARGRIRGAAVYRAHVADVLIHNSHLHSFEPRKAARDEQTSYRRQRAA